MRFPRKLQASIGEGEHLKQLLNVLSFPFAIYRGFTGRPGWGSPFPSLVLIVFFYLCRHNCTILLHSAFLPACLRLFIGLWDLYLQVFPTLPLVPTRNLVFSHICLYFQTPELGLCVLPPKLLPFWDMYFFLQLFLFLPFLPSFFLSFFFFFRQISLCYNSPDCRPSTKINVNTTMVQLQLYFLFFYWYLLSSTFFSAPLPASPLPFSILPQGAHTPNLLRRFCLFLLSTSHIDEIYVSLSYYCCLSSLGLWFVGWLSLLYV